MFRDFENVRVNQGIALTAINRNSPGLSLNDWEFGIFSQWGEDGIIQFLIHNLDISSHSFIEFGVEDFTEANCRFLLLKDLWPGLVIDGSPAMTKRIKQSKIYWKYPLTVECSFINRDNIEHLVSNAGFGPSVGILSVDIDGVDYFVLEAMSKIEASVVIVEYNGMFGSRSAVTVPYDENFVRQKAHHSNLYYGASLMAFHHLLTSRGYALVGGNRAGNNAFFVRRNLLNDRVVEVDVATAYRETAFAEARDSAGQMTFTRGLARRQLINHLPLIDVATGNQILVSELL